MSEQTETATVVVPAPEFEVAFAPYTSIRNTRRERLPRLIAARIIKDL